MDSTSLIIALKALKSANAANDAIAALGDVLNFKDTVATTNDLPLTGNKKGDVYLVTADSSEYVWISDSSSGTLSDYEFIGRVYSQVAANPTLAGTEADLTGLEVDGTKYAVPQPTNVVANPTLAGTEAALAGLEVGNTKYKVPDPSGTYLPLAGGTMTGDIDIGTGLIKKGYNYLLSTSSLQTRLGNTVGELMLICKSATDVRLTKGAGQTFTVLDSDNTSANPTLDGTEANLTSIKLSGTKYAIPSGGGQHLYWHQLNIRNSYFGGSCYFMLYNTISTQMTKDDLKGIGIVPISATMVSIGGSATDIMLASAINFEASKWTYFGFKFAREDSSSNYYSAYSSSPASWNGSFSNMYTAYTNLDVLSDTVTQIF